MLIVTEAPSAVLLHGWIQNYTNIQNMGLNMVPHDIGISSEVLVYYSMDGYCMHIRNMGPHDIDID